MTNREYLNQLSNYKLANILGAHCQCYMCAFHNMKQTGEDCLSKCADGIEEWLNKEYIEVKINE